MRSRTAWADRARGYSLPGQVLGAQHGYACLHLQHVGSDRSLWSGNVLGLSALATAAQESEAIHRVQDMVRSDRPTDSAWANTSILGKSWLQSILMVPTPA
ncbi:MAG: hypothetical protein IPJ18_22660 [Betaproteobacteria bacterium]|nr:hypothetical protein [Betaproteobacteria bacterium]